MPHTSHPIISQSSLSEPVGDWLHRWSSHAPSWGAAAVCQHHVQRFLSRTEGARHRLGQPLVVALLGGSGTGKSTLVNALLGEEVVVSGKQRPTTALPTLICHTHAHLERLQIDTSEMSVVRRELPMLERIVLIDCPDPDTSEGDDAESNLLRLRRVLPQCELLIVTGTQQKYRSHRVLKELTDAAPGVRIVFVQTHRDRDENIIDDWRAVLAPEYETGRLFCIDSIAALTAQQEGRLPDAEFLALRHLLTEEMTSEAARSIREANYIDLASDAVSRCQQTLNESWLPVEKLREKIACERRLLGNETAKMMRDEVMRDRRLMESRLIGRISLRWGYSPFSLLLRLYQGLGGLISGTLLVRARSIPQLAVWGVLEGARSIRRWRDRSRDKVAFGDDLFLQCEEAGLRNASLILAGYATDAHLSPTSCAWEVVEDEALEAGRHFVADVARSLDGAVDGLAERFNSLFFRFAFEMAFSVMLIFLVARPAKNFFWDTVVTPATPLLGTDYYLVSLFWLVLWGAILLGLFILAMRSGLERKIAAIADSWPQSAALDTLFHSIDRETDKLVRFRDELTTIADHLSTLTQVGAKLETRLGRRKPIA
ncbi:MAG: GTPase [Thermoguttaceae bacterium]